MDVACITDLTSVLWFAFRFFIQRDKQVWRNTEYPRSLCVWVTLRHSWVFTIQPSGHKHRNVTTELFLCLWYYPSAAQNRQSPSNECRNVFKIITRAHLPRHTTVSNSKPSQTYSLTVAESEENRFLQLLAF